MPASREEYHQLSYYTLAHPDPAFIHQHIVDAYTAQCADEHTKPIAVAFALIGLHLHVEQNRSGKEVQRMHMRLAKRRRAWPKLPLPPRRGTITVSDVLAAPAGQPRDALIRRWCESVWGAWADSHAQVRALLQETLG
jgi:hypothetical protein